MTQKYYWDRKKSLDSLFRRIAQVDVEEEIVAHLAKYLCILVSGFLETAVREIFTRYAQNKAHNNVANFVSRQLKRFHSPNMENILSIAGSFSQGWRESLQNTIEGELKDAVDSIVANRHNIAHGIDVGITYTRVNDYYKKAVKVIQLLDTECC